MGHCGDIQLGVYKGIDLAAHWHSEVEVIFVLEGSIRAAVGDHTVNLSEDDILLINSGISHQVTGKEALFCLVKYPWKLLSEMLGEENRMFVCSSAEDTERSYAELRTIFRQLIQQYIQTERHSQILVDSLLLKLLNELVEHFRVELGPEDPAIPDSDLRLQRIIQFVNQGYQHNLSLSKIAEELQVSTSTLSRFFKKKTGYHFVDYVNQIRLQAAVKELVGTENNMTQIAVNSGFSNLTVFNRVFRDVNGCLPAEYRALHQESYLEDRREQEAAVEEIRQHLRRSFGQEPQVPAMERVRIAVNAQAGKPYLKPWSRAINIGSAYQMTQANLRSHLLYLREQLHFQYARIWNVFSKKLMISDGQRVGECSFDHLDDVLDFLVAHHIAPYLALGKQPNTITRNGEEAVFQEFETIEFSSKRVWEHLVRSFVRHVVKRYGKEEVSGWIFELNYIPTGEPQDRLFASSADTSEYIEAFQSLYQILRKYVPQARVGGMGSVVGYQADWQRRMLTEMLSRQCPPDFCSIIVYPYRQQGDTLLPIRCRDDRCEEMQVAKARRMMDETGLQGCGLFVCEWNSSLSDRNYLNDSCYRSAYIARKVSAIWDSVDLMAVSIGSDWVGNYYDTYRVVNGGMGLLSQSNIRKPAFFVLRFLNSLGAYVIDRGEHSIVTRTDHGSYYILCFHGKKLGERYYQSEENCKLPNQLDSLYDNLEPLELRLVLEQMPPERTYTVKRRSINEREGSILPEWGRFRHDNELEESDIRYLREACFPRMSMERVAVRDGTLQIREVLQPNEVALLHIYEHTGV